MQGLAGHYYDTSADMALAVSPLQTHPGLNRDGLAGPVERRRLCRRKMPDRTFFDDSSAVPAKIIAFRRAFAAARLKPGMICPHKGVCLKSMPVIDGVVRCPAHGLRWNAETGEAVTTANPEKEEPGSC